MQHQAKLLLALAAAVALWLFSRTPRGQVLIGDVVDSAVTFGNRVRELIAGEEGLRLSVYQDTGGAWTIGWGHLVKPGERFYPYGDVRTITREEADALFEADITAARIAVDDRVRVPITDNQRAALISFVFNVGAEAFRTSTLLKKLNQGDYQGASEEFERWVYDNGVRVPGLVNRRELEQQVFLT